MGLAGKEQPLNWTSITRKPGWAETIESGIEQMEQPLSYLYEIRRQKFENKPANAQHWANHGGTAIEIVELDL